MSLTPQDKYDDVDDATLHVLVKTVRGTAVLAMVHDSAELGDVRTLSALHAVGRFRITEDDIDDHITAGERGDAVLDETAIALVDSLGKIISRYTMQNKEVGDEFVSPTMQILPHVLTMTSSITPPEKQLINRICHDVLDDLGLIEIDPEDPEEGRKDVVRSTRGVIASVACALNDPEILTRCAEVDNGMALQEHQKSLGLLATGNRDMTRFHPSAFALLFGSKECLEVYVKHDLGRLHAVAMSPTRGLDINNWRWTPFELLKNVQAINSLKPDVLSTLLTGLGGSDGQYSQSVKEWLPKEAVELAAKNAYLCQTVIDHRVMEADPQMAAAIVFKNALSRLAGHLLSQGLIDFPPLERLGIAPDADLGFPESHPIRLLTHFTSDDKVPAEHRDGTLAMVIHAMAGCGHGPELLAARDGELMSLSEVLVINGLTRAMGALVANGADVTQPTKDGLTLLKVAELFQSDDKDLHNLLRAAAARQVASRALVEIGVNAEEAPGSIRDASNQTPSSFEAWLAESSSTKQKDTPLVLWRAGTDPAPGEGPIWMTYSRAVAACLGNVDEDSVTKIHGYHVAMKNPAFDADVASYASHLDIEIDADFPLRALDFGNGSSADELLRYLKNNGHDGVIGIEASPGAEEDKWTTYIAFSPLQVKHLVGDELVHGMEAHAKAMDSFSEPSISKRRSARAGGW